MKCQSCGMSLPNDSEYCQYCGAKVLEQTDQEDVTYSDDEHIEQIESVFAESSNNDRITTNDAIDVFSGGGRICVDGPDGMPVWINSDQLGKKQTVNEEKVHELAESLKARVIPDYQSQNCTEKSVFDYKNDICPNCGQKLPNDSEFCQYCGKSLSDNSHRAESTENPIKITSGGDSVFKNDSQGSKSQASNHAISKQLLNGNEKRPRFCKECGGVVDSRSRKCHNCGKKYSRLKTAILVLIPAFIFLALLGLNVYQYLFIQDSTADVVALEHMLSEKDVEIKAKNGDLSDLKNIIFSLEQSITEKEAIIETKDTIIETKDTKISTLEDQNSDYRHRNLLLEVENADLREKAGFFDDICTALSQGNLGYAASNFQTSESVILVRKNQKERKITLTAHWTNGGSVSVSYSPPNVMKQCHASISFDSNSWQTSTTLTIIPQTTGIQTVTFSNDVDSKTFKIVIIVID